MYEQALVLFQEIAESNQGSDRQGLRIGMSILIGFNQRNANLTDDLAKFKQRQNVQYPDSLALPVS